MFELVLEKMFVLIMLGFWLILIVYFVLIFLGICKVVCDGMFFDIWILGVIIIGYVIPGFLFVIFLVVFFVGGFYWCIFFLCGLVSFGWEDFSLYGKIFDYFWYIILLVLVSMIFVFVIFILLIKNLFLDEIKKYYVMIVCVKGLLESCVFYGYVF